MDKLKRNEIQKTRFDTTKNRNLKISLKFKRYMQ